MSGTSALICFSHLRWDSVFQRPQHLLSRFARSLPVYVIEEPVPDMTAAPFLEMIRIDRNLTVCRPHVRSNSTFFDGTSGPSIAQSLRQLLRQEGIDDYCFWIYTPMALHVARDFEPRAVVYDCMDELSRFRFAPAELIQLEAELLRWADLVFTGGPSLYAAKCDRHRAVHCFPSSVEVDHFAAALAGRVVAHPATAALPRPRLGFYGVIDERLDLELIAGVADARPDWQLVMVGPVVKIEAAELPQRANIHYLGKAEYRDLPAHLAGWQVALMPFARNEATEFISPTKTLEYMAAGRPVVSTTIRDVAQPYGHLVAIADTVPEFVAAADRALTEDQFQRRRRLIAYDEILRRTSWDGTARAMLALLETVIRRPVSPVLIEPASIDLAASGP